MMNIKKKYCFAKQKNVELYKQKLITNIDEIKRENMKNRNIIGKDM